MTWLYSLPDLYQLSGLLVVCLMFLILLLCLKKLWLPLEVSGVVPADTARVRNLSLLFGHPLSLLLLVALAVILLFSLGLLTMLRQRQIGLLPDSSTILGVGGLTGGWGPWIGAALLPALFATGFWLARRPAPATVLVVPGAVLMLWGFFLIASLAWTAPRSGQAVPAFGHALRQACAAILGLGVLLLAGSFGTKLLRRVGQHYGARLGLALAALTLALASGLFRSDAAGQGLSLKLGSFALQFTDLIGVLFVIGLAASLARLSEAHRQRRPVRLEWVPLALLLLTIIALALQHAYGAALLLVLVLIALAWCCPPFRWWALGVAAICAMTLLFCLYLHRPLTFYEQYGAWRYPFSRHEQVAQVLWGIAGGGWSGAGPGRGVAGQLPGAQGNLIAVAVADSFGLAGVGVLLLAYATLALGGFALASRATGALGALLASGLTVLLVCQAILSLAGVSNLLPFTGLALPLVSRGGEALITSCLALGLIIAASKLDEAAPVLLDG